MAPYPACSYPADMDRQFIYHICQKATWEEAAETGEYSGSGLDLADGFIHFSTADQVKKTAALHLAGVTGLVLLTVPVEVVADALKWEPSRDGIIFPHLYRPLKFDEAVNVTDLELDTKRHHIFPRLR